MSSFSYFLWLYLPLYPCKILTAVFVDALSSSCNHCLCMFLLIFIILLVSHNSLVHFCCVLNSILPVL